LNGPAKDLPADEALDLGDRIGMILDPQIVETVFPRSGPGREIPRVSAVLSN
jgi:hypothetical protein